MMKQSRTFVFGSALASSALLLSGCLSSILPDPAPAPVVYRLSTIENTVEAKPDAMVLRIDRPSAPIIFMGQDVVVSPDGQRMATASQALWAEPIPSLIQSSLFDVLSTRENIIGVLPTTGARTTHRSHITVRNFEARFDRGPESAPLAVVQYTVTVSDASTRDLIGTHDVRKTVRADAANVSSIVKAQDEANQQAMEDIADWIEGLR